MSPDVEKIEVGKVYAVTHSRKGNFVARIKNVYGKEPDVWVEMEVVKGHAHFIASANCDRGFQGDLITVRKGFCTFEEVPQQ